jgi:predicted 3-demethylubiquinone-9 3-methyltransferase (glyoxalase superfamily)
MPQRIVPNLWFDTEAEEAAGFYTSVFDDSRIVKVTHYTEGAPRPAGTVMTVDFELNGQPFTGINGGPDFKFNEAVSLLIECDTQEEIDSYWERLRRRRGGPVRLAQGPLRPVVAGRARRHGRAVRRQRPGARRARDAGDAPDAQARHRRAAEGG